MEKLLTELNKRINDTGMRENQIGHSYFMNNSKPIETIKELQFVFAYEILPLLREYFYDDKKTLKKILGTEFILDNLDEENDWKTQSEIFEKIITSEFPEIFE